MSVVTFPETRRYNPLDDMEDLLEASGYSHNRETDSRLSFMCESKEGCYTIVLEWHIEFEAVKVSIISENCKEIDETLIDAAIEAANKTAWHGFFVRDGVLNIAFKSIVKFSEDCPMARLSAIEDMVDRGLDESDRLSAALPHTQTNKDFGQSLFEDEGWKVENLALMFSETKGNA
jgi:hypothetical protein